MTREAHAPRRTARSGPNRSARAALRRVACEMSPLEDRRLFAMTVGADGWTTFTPSSDTQIIHVSTSGNDSNSGSESAPVRTLARAKGMVREGKPDWILLRRGDVFNEVFGSWNRSGRSPDEPILIGTYGTNPERPVVRTNGLNADGITLAGGSTVPIRYLAIQGIRFTDNTHDGTEDKYGIRLQRTGSHFYIEDVQVDNFKDGIVIGMEPPNLGVSNVTLRRSVIIDNWTKAGHSQGLYASGSTNGLTIEQNVFDKNGWNPAVSGAGKTVFNHNMYINKGAQNVVIRDNISTRASLRGILTRGGGIVTGNLTARNAIGIETWGDATITNNVVLENGDIPNFPQGFGIQVLESNGDVTISNNIVAHDWSNFTYNVFGIRLWKSLNSATVRDNVVYNWRRPFWNDDRTGMPVLAENNHFQVDDAFHGVVTQTGPGNNDYTYRNNKYYTPRSPNPFWLGTQFVSEGSWRAGTGDNSLMQRQNYLDPNRELGSYNQFIGGAASFDAFIGAARQLSRFSYNLNYTAAPVIAYIRQGFNLGAGVGTLVFVQATDAEASEPKNGNPADPGKFTLTRTGPTTSALTVNYTIAGTATYGTDYSATVPITGTITFPAGAATVDVDFTPTADTTAEDPEIVEFRILGGSGYEPGAPASASVNITDGNGGTIPPIYGSGGGIGGGFIGLPYDPITAGIGLRGEYFQNTDFTELVTDRIDPNINYDYQLGAPAGTPLNADTFSVRWTGYVLPPTGTDGIYQFRVEADDGVRLYLDDLLVIDTMSQGQYGGDANGDGEVDIGDFAIVAANFNQSPKTFADGDFNGDQTVDIGDFALLASRFNTMAPPPGQGSDTGTMDLTGGFRVDLRLEYLENTGNAKVRLFWLVPDGISEEVVIPTNNLFPPDGYSAARPAGPTDGDGLAAALLPPAAPEALRATFSATPVRQATADVLLDAEREDALVSI